MNDQRDDDRRSKGGRPRAAEAGSSISAWIPARLHDRAIKVARQHDTSVSSIVRRALAQTLRDKP